MRGPSTSVLLITAAGALLLQACNSGNKPASPEQIRESTANATAQVKNDAKAMAEGVREGLKRSDNDQPLDINSASKSQLAALPGMTDAAAQRIIDGRPYSSTHELADKHIVSRAEYEKIANQLTVK